MAGTQQWNEEARRRFEGTLTEAGLDLVHWFSVGRILERTRDPVLTAELPFSPSHWGVLVGNSRAFWPRFLKALDPSGRSFEDPLDRHVESVLRTALIGAGHPGAWVRYSHTTEPRAFPMQRLADASEFARLGPAHLSVHPLHGPWIALRAVVVCRLAPGAVPEHPKPLPALCHQCTAPCVIALEGANAARAAGPLQPDPRSAPSTGSGSPSDPRLSPDSARWLAVRDACPVGLTSRYGDAQIAYHYDKNPKALTAL